MIFKLFRITLVTSIAIILFLLTFKKAESFIESAQKKIKNIQRDSLILIVDTYLKDIKVKSFLDTIAYAEGTYHKNGYKSLFTGKIFDNFSDHPRRKITASSIKILNLSNRIKHMLFNRFNIYSTNNIKLTSSAAGRYQILAPTWDNITLKLNLSDFSPINQDRAAVYLLKIKNIIDYIINNQFEIAIRKASKVWASLPGSTYGQPIISLKKLKEFYLNRLKYYKK